MNARMRSGSSNGGVAIMYLKRTSTVPVVYTASRPLVSPARPRIAELEQEILVAEAAEPVTIIIDLRNMRFSFPPFRRGASRGIRKQASMDSEAQEQSDSQERQRMNLNEVSTAMVRRYKDQFGRGPTKARTGYAGPDTLVSTLEDSLTPAERNMAKAGEHQRLRELRLYFQHASEKEFIGAVEQITGRKVRAFTSAIDTHVDVSTEAFYFEPVGSRLGHGPERDEELSP